jgi:hypothetical protein
VVEGEGDVTALGQSRGVYRDDLLLDPGEGAGEDNAGAAGGVVGRPQDAGQIDAVRCADGDGTRGAHGRSLTGVGSGPGLWW